MAIPATVSVNDGQTTPVSHSFEIVRSLPNGVDRLKSGTTLTEPIMLSIRHSSSTPKGGSTVVDRHVVTGKNINVDAAGKPYEMSFSFSFVIPRTSVFTNAEMQDLRAWIANFVFAYKDDIWLGKS